MMGVSYGGISQLFVAATRPPSLAAITPLSVIDNTATTLYPGGILNTGFALSWAKDRVHDAKPASATGGQAWALDRIQRRRQDLQGQPGAAHRGRRPDRQDSAPTASTCRRSPTRSSPVTFVHKIEAPVFLACQWTDEQTGGHCPDARRALHRHEAQVVHVHQRHPHRLARPGDVHPLVRLPRALRRAPSAEALAGPEGARPDDLQRGHGRPGRDAARRPDPGRSRRYGDALAAFEALPPVRILFDNGAGGATPGRPVAGFERRSRRFPLPRHAGAVVVPRRRRRARATRTPAERRRRRASPGTGRRARRPASPATPARAPAACGPPRRPTTGSRARAGTASPT